MARARLWLLLVHTGFFLAPVVTDAEYCAVSTLARGARAWLLLVHIFFLPPVVTDAEYCAVSTLGAAEGPSDGGTLVNLTGLALGDGSSWRCSFGALVVGAEYHDDTERVSCFSPRADADVGALAINVSIDGGSSFCGGEEMLYSYYPAPNVSAISPASGSHQGGTRVTVTGAGFSAAGGEVVCTFGTLRVGDVVHAGATSPATNVSDGQLECLAPSAHASAAVGDAFFSFHGHANAARGQGLR